MESAYDRKFEEMKKYIPFLESMIKRLESTNSASSNPRQAQLDKIRSLRDLLLDKKKRMKMENLLKCEQVLVNLYAKVEQRDAFPDVKQSVDMESAKSTEKSDLEIVRNKLKTVAKIQEGAETLPEIARANDIELHYTGSKEPALFQRRPNRSSKSPARTAQTNLKESMTKSPQSQHRRSYTRVLVSPDQSPRRWLNSEQSSSDQPLFSRRSPKTHLPSSTKKEKKKSKMYKSRKTNDLNITLNVPEESLNSLNTKDILSRIINCSDGDVDIDTLRELRTQILGELKQTGKNDDISDLILKSYNKKTKSKTSNRRKKDDVEEGELSDSESEAIESIYGSLVVVDKDKKSSAQVESTKDKDNQQRKIQICLVINSDNNELKTSSDFQQIIDFSEFEMLSGNESDKSKEIISVDSDTSSTSPKKKNEQCSGNVKADNKIDTKITECITVEDDNDDRQNNKVKKSQAENVHNKEVTNVQISNVNMEISDQKDACLKSSVKEDATKSPTKKDTQETPNEIDSDQKINSENMQDLVQTSKYVANFYKPIGEEEQNISATISCADNNYSDKGVPTGDKDVISEKKDSSENEIINTAKESLSVVKESSSTEKDEDDSQKIPLLNEPTVPPKAKTDVLSDIDILQALKKEILSDTIAMPGSAIITPALHQPKLTKVASAQEVMPKKRISIEKYKEKASTSTPTPKPLFIKKRNKTARRDKNKKQSLKLTEKECERFNFPRLSLDDDDDDDVDDLSDDDFLIEDKDDSLGLDDIYGDLAPQSPENEITNENSALPVIIPADPVKASEVSSRIDVDMRALLPIVSSQLQPVPQPVPPPLVPHVGFGAGVPPSPIYSIDMIVNETNMETTKKIADINRINSLDPRMRRDLNASAKNSPNPYVSSNPEWTPRSSSFSNIVPSAPSMTPSRTPIMTSSMTPNRTPIMTPSMIRNYLPSIPQQLTPNARSYEMTPSHQSFELEESSGRKHVYAPSFSTCDNRERESSVSKDGPHWEMNRNVPRSSRRNRWEESSIQIGGPKWEDRMSNSGQTDAPLTSRYEDSYKPKYDKYNNRLRCEKYNVERRDTYKPDCPTTPIPSFGWSECPPTPGSAFGRQEAPMTPSHSFGRSECPSTPSHPFSRSDCPTTPINSFGRTDCPSLGRLESPLTSSHSFRSECPSTPSHSFGRSECPSTPSHSFGRGDCPQTPMNQFGRSELPFGRSDISNTSNNQKFTKDPRLNRRPTEYESSSASERDRDYQSERGCKRSSYKPHSKHYSDLDASRNYEREMSVGSHDRNYFSDRGVRQSKDAETDCRYTRNRESRYDGKYSKNYENVGSSRDQREKNVVLTSENKKQSVENARSTSRAVSVGRPFGKEHNKDKISFKSDAGRDFTIDTSIKSTFQDFLSNDYSFDARKQRASSVGRSLIRENNGASALSTMTITSATSTNRNERFKRASSLGRDLVSTKNNKSFLEIKADFEAYRSNLKLSKIDTNKELKKDKNEVNSRSRKDIYTKHPEQITNQSRPYSPRKNYRDPRMRKEFSVEHKSRYKIDRRVDLYDRKKSGIIYSNDNIAKGTIMGFGVKNYKIPKIKRVTVEPKEKAEEKTVSVEKRETNEKHKVKESENDKKNKPKCSKEIVNVKDKTESENNKMSNVVDDSDRVTRSKNKANAKQGDSVIKTRKSKRSVIYDSESDSGSEKEETEKQNSLKSPTKKTNDSKKTISRVIEKEVQNKSSEELFDSSFGIDDMEIFPENIGSDPVIENINALIADLDNDLDSSKISNDGFVTETGKMLEPINSPEDNSLGDISEVIENDLNESNEDLQQQIVSNTTLQGVKLEGHRRDLNNKTLKDLAIEKPAAMEISFSGSNVTKPIKDTTLSKVNEAIVSTTEILQSTNIHEDNVKKSSLENTAKNEEGAISDSTTIKILDKTEDGLPDSTNEMHCDLSSDVTSTYDALETSKNESETQNLTHKETFNSIGTLLSMLQDKSKIKELLSMLGNQSSDNEKIKKKLEKLSEIVSDEEDENEVQQKVDNQKEKQLETKIEGKSIEKPETINKSHELDEQNVIDLKDRKQGSGGVPQIQNIESEVQKDKESTPMKNIKSNERESSALEVVNGFTEKYNTMSDEIEADSLISINEDKNDENEKSENKNRVSPEKANETNKLNDEEYDNDDLDNEPLMKKVTRKIRGRKSNGKFKTIPKKKEPVTGDVPSKIEVKEPVNKKKPSRELQKLQEDIKEMFMSDDILNATGIRMCRLAKMVSENESASSGPVVVLEKVKGLQNQNQPLKLKKKSGPKPKHKGLSKSANSEKNSDKRAKSSEMESKMDKPKALPKYKPGPKSKIKQKSEEIDPYEFDTDSVTDTNTTKGSDDESYDSENESLASSHSFGSNEVLAETNKKTKRKRRGMRGWQSGIIKPKNKKKKEQKQESLNDSSPTVNLQRTITIPDLNCFTDKEYCFQKGTTTYDCRLCVFSGTDIVNHYKKQHPHTEIPLSRMDPQTAEVAIQQCEEINFHAISKIPSDKYTCRFCRKEFGTSRTALETFFWHIVSNHTGEFKHLCSECVNVTRCPFNLDIPPPPKDGGQLIGYICGKCNFTQISLENLKTHVIVRHNDEQTEVYTINLAVMSKKAMKAMLRRTQAEQPRVLRSLRSNRSTADTSDCRDDRSDVTENSDRNSEHDPSQQGTEDHVEEEEHKPMLDQTKAKLTFENDEPGDETSVKMEQEADDRDESSHFEDTFNTEMAETSLSIDPPPFNTEMAETSLSIDPPRRNRDDIMDYPHFKQNKTESGTKEYVCCINGNDNHYKTSLLISMKKHIQTKHSEKWDGYCCLCKVIVTLQGVQSDFKDCLSHFLDKHMDDFPMLENVVQSEREESLPVTSSPIIVPVTIPTAVPDLPTAIPARVATPPVERTASPSYIAVRPLAELISKELVKETETQAEDETRISFPKIENVVSLGDAPTHRSPVYPTTAEPASQLDKPFLYEDVQAAVMSKKHRVVLDGMMSKENLVRLFKCAGRFCSFTSDSPEDALLHASTHQRVGGEGALNCAYCNYDACDNGIDLVMHVFKEHSRCQYCCPLCFYRAAASQLVGMHYKKAHSGSIDLKYVLRSTSAVTSPAPGHSSGLLEREVAVQHFFCSHDGNACNFKTYTPGKFIEHLQQWHSTATSHPCNQCSSKFTSPSELVIHLRTHGLMLYQCTWCVYGADSEQKLLMHAASRHPDRQPQAYVRVITNKDGNQRVLPLAYLNKSKVATEDVIPNTTKENPVREAERSIELEKLIGHTMLMFETSMSQSSAREVTAEETPTEEPVELPPDNLHEDNEHQEDEPSAVEPLLTSAKEHIIPDSNTTSESVSMSAEKIDIPEKIQDKLPNIPVKCEPADVLKDLADTEIICLDSDDDEASNTMTEKAPEQTNDDISKSNSTEEARTPRLSEEVSISSVTDEVTITKITDESSLNSINNDDSRQNIIDLSDDEPLPVNTPPNSGTGLIVKKELFKCPYCFVICKSCHGFKKHVKKCTDVTNIPCPHKPCMAVITGLNKLAHHYMNVHNASTARRLENFCGICNNPFATLAGAKTHIKTVHKVQKYAVAMAKDEQGNLKYIIQDGGGQLTEPPRISARKTSTEIQRYTDLPSGRSRKTSTDVKKKYGIEDIDKLPISPILDTQVYCELCEFGTKVRLNMVRHLLLHAGSMPVPHTAPVNPVPHLETNEKHFDKMVNLASSSVVIRAPDKPQRPEGEPSVTLMIPPAESSRYPKYVPERQRYTCGAKGCLYISVDMAMFRCHWETLHAGNEEYRCVHCPPHQSLDTSIPLTAARILAHLRMHDVNLYACSVCSYYHYRKHLVEKHLSEMHKDGSVKIVREENTSTPVTPPPVAGAPTMDLKAWQCGLCKFTSMLRPEVVIHCGNEHLSKMQFKCAYCPFRTSTKENVVKHQTNAHPTKAEEIFYYFYREGSIPDDADGVPRWQKQRQKLGLEEPEVKTEPEPLPTVREDQVTLPPITTPVAIDLNLVKKEVTEEPSPGVEMSIEDLCKKFGQFCEPDGIKYKCSLCNVVREHTKEAMQCHLYEELNYRRWECVTCLYKAFHKTGLNEHMASEHSRQYTHPRALPIDVNIEKWVLKLLEYQTSIIETNVQNLAVQKVQGERPSAMPTSPKKAESPKPALSATDAELEAAFGEFGAPRNQQFSCPKCDFLAKDEADMVLHLESELTKIRWGCTNCTGRFQTFHEAQFHCKSAHIGQLARPKEAIRDPSLRTGWITAVVINQRQFMKCISETGRETTPERNDDSEQNENSLLVARYDTPVQTEEQLAIPAKRAAPSADSDEERLVIDEPQKKKLNDRQCPYCDYNTPTARCLREHILKHYGIKPYKCWYCPFDGSRPHVLNHQQKEHPHQYRLLKPIEVPNYLPKNLVVKSSKREVKEKEQDDVPKTVCLYCEKSVPESETESHIHGNEKPEFAHRGEVVVKCCNCLVLRLTLTSLQEHFDACHPSEKLNYAYFKLQIDTREIYCCGHCYKKFKFLRDLKAHHTAIHTSLSLSYTSIPFSHNLHTEGDLETKKRRIEDTAGPSTKRVARKSTTKLPNSAVAKKSTTKLPFSTPELEEYSYYGTKPLPFDQYADVTLLMPMYNTTVEINIKKLSGILKIDPKVVLENYKT